MQEVGGGQLDVRRILKVRSIDYLDGFQVLHVFYGNGEKNRPRVAGHRGHADNASLGSHTLHWFRVNFCLWVQHLYVGDLDGFLRLSLHYKLWFLRSAGTRWNSDGRLLDFRLDGDLRGLGKAPFSVALAYDENTLFKYTPEETYVPT